MTVVKFSAFEKSNIKVEEETTLTCVTDDDISRFENNPQYGMFRILNQIDGDKRLVWNRMNMADINEAEKMFNSFIGEGMVAHRIGGDGKPGVKIENFDPTAEEIIFIPMKMVTAG